MGSYSQNENSKWYFGYNAGLNFTTNPPTVLLNGRTHTGSASASISDALGNLLFYTQGDTIWNSLHLVMANGGGLIGNPYFYNSQFAAIVRRPGSVPIYYIVYAGFINGFNLSNNCYYSIVDLSLASGQGSVTVKNANLFTGNAGKIAVTRHCNGTDLWIILRTATVASSNYNYTVSTNFNSYLITNSGISPSPIVSPGLTYFLTSALPSSGTYPLEVGDMKISPNGKKLGISNQNCFMQTTPLAEIYDFDNSTGAISNQLVLSTGTTSITPPFNNFMTGCEFSGDGSKFYSCTGGQNGTLYQWNLCAGSSTAIAASVFTVSMGSDVVRRMQLAQNGKLYLAGSAVTSSIHVINSPNSAGSSCNYSSFAQSVSPNSSRGTLPYFMADFNIQLPPAVSFSYSQNPSLGCQTASFSSNYSAGMLVPSCAGAFSITSIVWDFGDPLSGVANTSNLGNPIHVYSNFGTYTAQLVLYYSCGGGTDTLRQVVNINQPCLTINSTSITCANLGSATVTSLPNTRAISYTWLPVGQTGSVATGLVPGTYTLLAFVSSYSITHTYTAVFLPLVPLTGSISVSPSITCNGASTATGSISNLAGGSGTQTYFWTNGTSTSSVPNPTNLSAGNWSVTVTDALTACQVYSVFTITQPPALTLNIASSSASACAGTNITFTATNSGGTPAYTYTWVGAGSSNTRTVTQVLAGNYIYTVNSRDVNLCLSTKTVSVSFVPNPTLSVSNVSICPLETGTLIASGANTYTWLASTPLSVTATSFTASPVASQQYSVIGTALGCTAATTASIFVKPIPSPTISNNSPICNGQNLLFNSSGGVSYLWAGPNSFTSIIQNPTINPASPIHSGVYNLTVTGVNSCTASASTTVIVNPTPTVSLNGGPVCLNSNLVLSANSFTGSSYLWAGPNSFTSSLQNPTISAVTFSAAGTYSLFVNSINSCSNTATVSVIVNTLPTISIVPTSTVICFGKSTNLVASGGNSYLWNTSSSATTLVVSPTVNATYTVIGFSAAGCTNTAIQSISVNALPLVTVVMNPSVYCSGGSSTLTGLGASTYTWSNNATTTIISVNPVFTSFYNVKGTDAITGCSNTAFATVSVNPLPLITASASKSIICTGISATLIAGGGHTYTWMPVNLNAGTIFPVPPVTTSYTLTGTNTLTGCSNSALKTISVNITPTLNLVSNTPSLCAGRSAIITPSGALTYTLNPGNLTGTNFTVTPASTTQYSLSGTNSVNCVNLQPSNLSIIVYSLTPITGVVTSTTGQNNGNVVLYKYKPALGRWDSLNTSLIILTGYNFPSVPTGTYVVKAFPFPTDIVETYGLSSSSWQGAAIINHDCINSSIQNINLITIDNTIKSKATLSGKISQGAGYSQPGSPGAPIPNIIVKAGIHTGTTIVQRSRTNAQGNYTLANLMPNAPGKDYYILVDIPGLDTNTTYHRIIITGFENFTNLDFVVDSQRITPTHLTVGIKELNTSHANIKVYPNPANDKISIEFELDKSETISIDLSDLSGRSVKEILSESKQTAGALTILAGVSDLKEGMYLLNIRIGNEEREMKLVVER